MLLFLIDYLEKLVGMREVNLSAATCGKNDSMDYALGYSCGTIKLHNLRKVSTCDHKFIGGNSNMMSMLVKS